MADKRVRVSYGRTVQSAPYESIRLDVAIEKDVADDLNISDEVNKSVDSMRIFIKQKIQQILDAE